uniref:Uncharacterized protein n=1 Tax=Arundo donax TaxID=35708 RepID=A0A0A9CE02_ARUDO
MHHSYYDLCVRILQLSLNRSTFNTTSRLLVALSVMTDFCLYAVRISCVASILIYHSCFGADCGGWWLLSKPEYLFMVLCHSKLACS